MTGFSGCSWERKLSQQEKLMDMLKKGAGKESKNYHRGYDFRVRNKEKGFWSLMLP